MTKSEKFTIFQDLVKILFVVYSVFPYFFTYFTANPQSLQFGGFFLSGTYLILDEKGS